MFVSFYIAVKTAHVPKNTNYRRTICGACSPYGGCYTQTLTDKLRLVKIKRILHILPVQIVVLSTKVCPQTLTLIEKGMRNL